MVTRKPEFRLADLPAEIRTRILVNPATGCWEWQFVRRSETPDWFRYGKIMWEGYLDGVHRVAYKLLVGPIPEEYELDHVYARGCRSHACCWPAHLEPVPRDENLRRGRQANIGRGVALTVQRRIALGQMTDRERALADAVWMLPFPPTGWTEPEPRPEPKPTIGGLALLHRVEEAAVMVGVEVEQMVAWRKKNTGPLCFKVGRNWLYPADRLMAYLERRDNPAA